VRIKSMHHLISIWDIIVPWFNFVPFSFLLAFIIPKQPLELDASMMLDASLASLIPWSNVRTFLWRL